MNILFVAPYIPNLIRTRPYNFIRFLTVMGHRLTVVAPWANEEERQDVEELSELCDHVITTHLSKLRSIYNCMKEIPTQMPLQAVYCWQPALADLLIKTVKGAINSNPYDVIHVEHLRGAQYGTLLNNYLARGDARIPIVWDSVDNISYLFGQSSTHSKRAINRLITKFELGRTQKYERWLVDQFDQILVTSIADRDAFWDLRNQQSREPVITILPNGVDLEYF